MFPVFSVTWYYNLTWLRYCYLPFCYQSCLILHFVFQNNIQHRQHTLNPYQVGKIQKSLNLWAFMCKSIEEHGKQLKKLKRHHISKYIWNTYSNAYYFWIIRGLYPMYVFLKSRKYRIDGIVDWKMKNWAK